MLIKTLDGEENLLVSLEYAELTNQRQPQFVGLLQKEVKKQSVYLIANQYESIKSVSDYMVDIGNPIEILHFKDAMSLFFESIRNLDLSDKAVRLKIHDYKVDTVEVQHIFKYVVSHALKYDLDTEMCDMIESSKGFVIEAHTILAQRRKRYEDKEPL